MLWWKKKGVGQTFTVSNEASFKPEIKVYDYLLDLIGFQDTWNCPYMYVSSMDPVYGGYSYVNPNIFVLVFAFFFINLNIFIFVFVLDMETK